MTREEKEEWGRLELTLAPQPDPDWLIMMSRTMGARELMRMIEGQVRDLCSVLEAFDHIEEHLEL